MPLQICRWAGNLLNSQSKINWRANLWTYAPVFLWIGVIFFLSSNQGSMSQTSLFIRPLLKFLFPTAPEETLQIYHGYIRKSAHFAEYALLAFFAVRAFARSSLTNLRNLRYLLPIVLVAVIASIDEFNQGFEASRTGSFRDVLLDIAGGTAMVAILWLIKRPRPACR